MTTEASSRPGDGGRRAVHLTGAGVPTRIAVPVPGLVVLIGAAGSGKSTLAVRVFDPSEVISSDALREAISGDAADQRATRPAFAALHRDVRRRLLGGRVAVVDATNVERFARRSLLRLAALARVPAVAIVLAPPFAEVHARNASRPGRVVAADVVDRHLATLARLGADEAAIRAALLAEGFANAHIVVDAGGVTVERIRSSPIGG